MPQRNDYNIKARHVRKGDIIDREGVEYNAETIKAGPKWTEVRDVNGKLLIRMLNDVELLISRVEPTEEEREAQRRAFSNDMIAHFVEGHDDQWMAAQIKFAEEVAGGYDAERYSFVYSALMYAHATHALKTELVKLYEGVRKNTNPNADWVEVWAMYREDKIDSLIDYGFRGNSRSTSMISNLLEDVQHEVIAKAVRREHYPH